MQFLLAWITPWRSAFKTKSNSGITFFAHWRDLSGRHIAKYGVREEEITAHIHDLLDKSSRGIFVDIGANIGWHTIHAAKINTVDMVVAFEPDSYNAWLLDKNLTENKISNVIARCEAVGEHPSLLKLHRYKSSNYGRHSLVNDFGYGSKLVPVINLDLALAQMDLDRKPISLLKIDVEGAEAKVIAGAAKALSRTQAILLECTPSKPEDGEMLSQLFSLGFHARALFNGQGANRITNEEALAAAGQPDILLARD